MRSHGGPVSRRIRPQPRRQGHQGRNEQGARRTLRRRDPWRQPDDRGPVRGAVTCSNLKQQTSAMFHRARLERRRQADARRVCAAAARAVRSDGRDGSGDESCANAQVFAGIASGDSGGVAGSPGARGSARDNDLNRDGKVTRAEFDQVTVKHSTAATGGATAMTACAVRATGCAARVSEIAARVQAARRGRRRQAVARGIRRVATQKLFARLDKNKDGVITRDEIVAAPSGAGRKAAQIARGSHSAGAWGGGDRPDAASASSPPGSRRRSPPDCARR